ncbi:Ferritin-like domain-containing protein [Tumidithrix helvetica PCC 7403]|uniref:ferritin-like domain-containing protein n=1 Tax=Tumidithrix helvetica TaxID=3457545 RepID=UPI003CABA06A
MSLDLRIAGLDLPHAKDDRPLQRILAAALKERGDRGIHTSAQGIYWNAPFFNLDRVKLFQDADDIEQITILQLANQSLLEEAYFIEKAGVGYMAKMVLLAETVEERMLYALFAADEATHLSQIGHFLPVPEPDSRDRPFLRLLADVVNGADKAVLLFVVQVVLEGWGIGHYRQLAKTCGDRRLSDLFSSFLHAEARHHSTGFTLFDRMARSTASHAAIADVLATFLRMVQVGPQSVVGAIEQVKGHLTRSQKIQILQELGTETHSGKRLQLLRSLMRGETAVGIVQALAERGAFEPLPPDRCL